MYEDVSVTAHMSCPHSFASEVFRSLLCIGTVQGSAVCVSLPDPKTAQISLFIVIPYHSPTSSCDLAILNTFLSTNFGAKASEYQTSFITCTS